MPMTSLPRRHVLGLAAGALTLPALARAGTTGVERIGGPAFGTQWQLVAPGGAGLERLRPAIAALLAEVDAQVSPWRADSEITVVNRGGEGVHPVSPETAHVAQAALALAEASDGHFDPTVGPLVARWGFGPIDGDGPTGWAGLQVEGARIAKARAGLTLDLCGIAKGRALDRVAALARDAGHDSLLLDIGGELLALGRHPSGRPWQVAVEDPRPGHDTPAALLSLTDRAVGTSGLRAQGYALPGGATYGHIIDPATGAPAQGALRSVTVTAPDAMTADGWATALFAAGAADGPALARRHGLSALFLSEDGDTLRAETTGDIPEALIWNS
ncbi:FAD:protein FMN transferase [Roseicyclus persicicus]|uniref:FAD:protein FMN transferase n=1 Tax=Roseicyclus persicicus TaxID=2650661 RepID=A0A7X6JXU7_9RHOB|nr:FAD:protein FMN transferase [Roseibacterium persicicum]NKX43754.1 FAD:protein FMN transferase [Roseibacterium persicicum]